MNPNRRPLLGAVAGLLIGLLVAGFLVLTIRTWSLTDDIRASQVVNANARKSSDDTLHAIQDCTQPSGECFQRGQKRTASAVGDINKVVILAAACSVGLPASLTVDERQSSIQSCVIDGLADSRTTGP